MTLAQTTKDELDLLRASLIEPYEAAQARGDKGEMDRLTAVAAEIDYALIDLALGRLADLAGTLATLSGKVDALRKKAAAWPFPSSTPPADQERFFRQIVPENDFEDPGPGQPAPKPAPVAPDAVPKVQPGWAQNYQQLWDSMTVLPEWSERAGKVARHIVANQGRYATAVAGTPIPWWFVGVVHALESDLNFNTHLHNGDPLTARTVQIPKERPPFGTPPFTWEESARDALVYEKLDKITDWSLPNVLYNWHRYNGINNEYKRRGIPTPYLWSGSQHYRKGKYVADGVFDPEKPSKQVGAAVLLKTLIEIGAVAIDAGLALTGNPAAATGNVDTLKLDFDHPDFKHVLAELDYPGPLAAGAGGSKKEKQAVVRVQEWLNIHGFVTSIDGAFGDSTADQLKAFQRKAGRPATGELDPEIWSLLTAPIRRALAAIDHASLLSLEDAVLRVARQHIDQAPVEIGGNNRGPWVRLYMEGKDGDSQKWCAGFVCFVVEQAARTMGSARLFKRRVGVDELVADAKDQMRFVAEGDVDTALKRQSKLRPGGIFVVRASDTDWTHTGIVLALNEKTFDTLEGNTGGDGGTDGPNARQGNRSFANKDFLRLI